ncbi:major facilitator superfamily domain-containing protein [Chaetomidium leptoderma]|uniref:Major facilitator superfamily domain-containing protein n=1 Tax=Chaetomidium leptoderma TaxID=669021 RepID=A0AAN6VK36_9PEZI|nr:major facilitator superfamily domain-containing protein [Chaetomidium leptoderma]
MSEQDSTSKMVQNSDSTALESGPDSENKVEPGVDSSIIDWDGPDDIENPVNWPVRRRWAHIIMISTLGLITNLAPTICAPSISSIVADLGITSETVGTLAITLYVLGIAVGPIIISPLSEVYGRLPVYHAASLVFVAFVIGNALSNTTAQFIVFRFISGCAGGVPMALGGGSIADLTQPPKRGMAMTLFSLGPLTGPVLGPLIGGFIAGSKGWRWTFWVLAIVGGAAGVVALVVLRETHPRILLERKAARLRAETGNVHLRSKLAVPLTPGRVLRRALTRPTMLLFRSPILLVLSLYVGLVFGIMYLLFTTFVGVFEGQYGFTTSTSGLVYLGLGTSMIVAVPVFNTLNGRMIARATAQGLPGPRPEERLLPMIWFGPSVATAELRVHWIAPIIGTAFIGFGAFFVLMPVQLYLVNLFGSEYAASALSVTLLLRFVSGTFLPLAGPIMYQTLHYGWGNSLLALLTVVFLPFPILFYKYGERLRAKTAVKF